MKIFLDDIRDCPKGFTLCRTGEEAIKLLYLLNKNEDWFISFDHDLGENCLSGYDVASHIEKMVYNGVIKCPKWEIHSSNPIGRKRIEQTMQSAERFSKR